MADEWLTTGQWMLEGMLAEKVQQYGANREGDNKKRTVHRRLLQKNRHLC
jgi:hypothetical protein